MNANLPLPKYHQIYLVLREQLQEGRFVNGVPAEVVLSKQFGVGRVTVRRALEQLADEGLITREPGRGTWPARNTGQKAAVGFFEHSGQARPTRLTGLLENLVSTSLRTTVALREWRTITASESVANALALAVGDKVKKVVRVRSSDDGPVSHITTYLPYALARNFGRRELGNKAILLLLEEAGVELGRAHQTVSARQADATIASELGVAVGSALLAVRRLVFDTDERPVQWLHGLYRPDRYEYQMEVSKVGSIDAKISVNENVSG
ncbi:MAG: GntR family transcriptional regulator [Rhodoferax sp.]|nr:GntR family transcriptional regulator [Rhodoferax sp.]